jgi:hypothetical protein
MEGLLSCIGQGALRNWVIASIQYKVTVKAAEAAAYCTPQHAIVSGDHMGHRDLDFGCNDMLPSLKLDGPSCWSWNVSYDPSA